MLYFAADFPLDKPPTVFTEPIIEPNHVSIPAKNASESPEFEIDTTDTVHTLCIAATTLLIFTSNILMILVITITKSLRNPHGYLLFSVAIADLLVGVEAILGFVTIVTMKWPTDHLTCDIMGYITSLAITVTMYTLAAMSIERWISVHKPLHYLTIVTRKRTLFLIFSIWVISFAIYTPFFNKLYEFGFIKEAYVCMINLYHSRQLVMILTTITTVPSLLIIIICSLWIFKTAHRHAKQIQTEQEFNLENIYNRHVIKMNKHIKTTLLITVAFCATWLPYYFFQIYITVIPLTVLNENRTHLKRIFFVVKWALISNSYVNWIICTATDKVFRDGTVRMFSVLYKKLSCSCRKKDVRRDSQNEIYYSEALHL